MKAPHRTLIFPVRLLVFGLTYVLRCSLVGRDGQVCYLESAQLVVDALPGGLVQNSGIINDIICGGPGLVHDVEFVCQRITGAQQ